MCFGHAVQSWEAGKEAMTIPILQLMEMNVRETSILGVELELKANPFYSKYRVLSTTQHSPSDNIWIA